MLGTQTLQRLQNITNSGRVKHPNKIVTSKYSLVSFIPLNILHQLSKPSTLFFFITSILICIPAISPFEPWSYILAFLIVIGISIVKDAIEDYNRHCNDKLMNEKTCREIHKEDDRYVFSDKMVMDVREGDWLYVKRDEEVCADVVLVRAEIEQRAQENEGKLTRKCINHCFVDTSNLDGESNLKKRSMLFSISDRRCSTPSHAQEPCRCIEQFYSETLEIKMKETGDSFSDFQCEIETGHRNFRATKRHALLRGSILKNVDYATCLVVAVGPNTKQSTGTSKCRKKKSVFEKRMDYLLFLVAILYVIILLSTFLMGAYMGYANENTKYILGNDRFTKIICLLFSNYILYSYLVPLSLYVMVEMARFIHSQYVSHDPEMEIDGTKSVCHNSNVIEDLGLIDYILTDKTGTITKNSMTLRAFHINGDTQLKKADEILNTTETANEAVNLLLLNILLCNSVEVLNREYQGISQDELCFLKTLTKYGYELLERETNYVTLRIKGEVKRVEILYTLEFTSKRQYMSVIVNYDGTYLLFCKGSDQKLLNPQRDLETIRIINNSGDYRSLVLRYRELSKEVVDAFQAKPSREALAELHREMEYLGTTFIEDELQEGVPETMEAMHKAGIHIWMITGDKQETAVCCARNAGIIRDLPFLVLEGKDVVDNLGRMIYGDLAHPTPAPSTQNSPNLAYEQAREAQNETARAMNLFSVKSLIIYRATPSQKGKITMLMTKAKKNILAIGDGNNDVAMLKGAHVGVGIMGKEGAQASLSGDLAIPQFKLLSNLILLHGRYNLIRYSKISLNAFYKNILFIFIQFFYNFCNGASGRSIYNDFFLNYYNLFFTSLIPFSIVLFDRDADRGSIMRSPDSYRIARAYFSRTLICINIGFAVLQAATIFAIIYAFTSLDICSFSGLLGGYGCLSTIFSIVIFFTVILRQYRLISFVVWYSYAATVLSVLFMLILLFGIQDILVTSNALIYRLVSMPVFFVILLGTCGTIYTADVFFEIITKDILTKSGYEPNTP